MWERTHFHNQHLLEQMVRIAELATEVEFAQCIKQIAASLDFDEFEYVLTIKKPLINRMTWRLQGQINELETNHAPIHHSINESIAEYKMNTNRKTNQIKSRKYWTETTREQEGKESKGQVLIQEYEDSYGAESVFKLKRIRGIESGNINAMRNRIKVLAALLHASGLKTIGIKLVANERPKLTGREVECLNWCARGKTAYEIGMILNISEPTAVYHLGNIVRKMQVNNRINAIAKGVSLGLVA